MSKKGFVFDSLYGIAKGLSSAAKSTGVADAVRSLNVAKKSEKLEEKVLDPVTENTVGGVTWISKNWQLLIIGAVAILILLKD